MGKELEHSESTKVEAKLSSVLSEISNLSEKHQKDFSFYWSKKSPSVAASVYKVFAKESDVILDPFVGSGSALYGLKLFPNKLKFIGVDVNQLPIELIHFNMNYLSLDHIEEITRKIDLYIKANEAVYSYAIHQNEEPFVFKKAHLNREHADIEPTLLAFARGKEKLVLTIDDGEKFLFAKNAE